MFTKYRKFSLTLFKRFFANFIIQLSNNILNLINFMKSSLEHINRRLGNIGVIN